MRISKAFALALALGALLTACSSAEICVPCMNGTEEGFKYRKTYDSEQVWNYTHCVPCRAARTPEQFKVCFGSEKP